MRAVVLIIFFAVVSGEKASNEPANEGAHHEPPKKHKPLFSFPHLPTLQELLPSVSFPQLHLPHLPALPHLPTIPKLPAHFKKETVTATKTVFVELTKRVTRHPICVTAYGIKPPCLGESHQREVLDDFEENMDQLRKHQIIATPVPSLHEPATRIFSRVTESEGSIEEPKEIPENKEINHRQGRYIVRHPIPMLAMEVRSEPQYRLVDSEKEKLKGLLKATHHVTQTIWVTKIEKIYDHAVTATLVAQNCFPSDTKIPLCGPIHTEPNRFSGPIDDGGYYGGLFAGQPAPVPVSHIPSPDHHEIVPAEHSLPEEESGPENELEHGTPVDGTIHSGTVAGVSNDWKDENEEDKESNP